MSGPRRHAGPDAQHLLARRIVRFEVRKTPLIVPMIVRVIMIVIVTGLGRAPRQKKAHEHRAAGEHPEESSGARLG